jgi:hypothetical protein
MIVKAYIMTTGTAFGLIVVAHVWRVAVEGLALAKDPAYILLTLAAAGLTVWSWRVLRAVSTAS